RGPGGDQGRGARTCKQSCMVSSLFDPEMGAQCGAPSEVSEKMSTETPPKGGAAAAKRRKVTTARLAEMKARGEKIAMLTAYDFSFARLLDESGIDAVLVGDSASNVIHGHETTVPITLDQM